MTIEDFPFNNQFYNLVEGKTLSKRGKWWTALLLVEPKPRDDANDNTNKKEKIIKKKVIIQRWQRFKNEEQISWRRSKDFTISSKNQWTEMQEILNEWVDNGSWA